MLEVKAIWDKKFQAEVKARQFNVRIDEPPMYHGEDTGMMPTELMLCSLASCFCLALVYAANKRRVEIKDMSVNVVGETDIQNFKFSRLMVEIESSLPSDILDKIINLAKRYCFVSNTIAQSCPIEYTIKTD